MLKEIKIQCPAKINLTLKITGKRDDGFHNLDSIMQTISLFDYLTIKAEESDKTEIILSGTSDEIPYNEKNLVYKAAKLFLDTTQIGSYKISIFIEKNIPVAAGLAGGSTNAAGTLYGLNRIFDEPLNRKQLHELCATLGSDLNLCLEGGRQKTSGRGEILEPLPFKEFEVSLIKPINLGISAKEAYTKFGEKMNNIDPTPKSEISTLPQGEGNVHHSKINPVMKQHATELRNNPTPQEYKLWLYLRTSQFDGIKFRRQQIIDKYIVDFVSFEKRIIIELDGGQHAENIKYDKKRDDFLKSQNFNVIRIWNNDIDTNIDGVLEYISEQIKTCPPHAGGPKSSISGWGTTRSDFVNDLEWAVIDDYKELQHIKEKYPNSVMSGSGSTYFGLGINFENEDKFWVKNNLKSIPYGVKEI